MKIQSQQICSSPADVAEHRKSGNKMNKKRGMREKKQGFRMLTVKINIARIANAVQVTI